MKKLPILILCIPVFLTAFFRTSAVAQVSTTSCDEVKFPPQEPPSATLCSQYGGMLCTAIGAGTGITKASDLPSNPTQGSFCIQGDFLVDENFTFQNSIIEIEPGVQITIAQSAPNTSPIGLWLENSKLFACQGLWKGIFMSPGTVVVTSSNTQIEDAEVAIKAHSDYISIGCQNTTFNRNRIGISINGGPGKNVYTFKSNTFSCTSPLNGTDDEITFAGVELINNTISLNSAPFNKSVFKDLIYGVHCSGNSRLLGEI
jgi:hypothetical protein